MDQASTPPSETPDAEKEKQTQLEPTETQSEPTETQSPEPTDSQPPTGTSEQKQCPICQREFREGEFQHNIDLHINSHKFIRPQRKRNKVKHTTQKNSLESYFVKKAKTVESTVQSSCSESVNPISASVTEMIQDDVDVEEVSSFTSLISSHSNPPVEESATSSTAIPCASIDIINDKTTQVNNIQAEKCAGLNLSSPSCSDIFHSFPFQLLSEMNVVFENGNFHHTSCADSGYQILEKSNEIHTPVNKICFDLKFSPGFQKIASNMIDTDYHNSTAHDDQLSFLQLKLRLNKARENAKQYRLSNLNLTRKLNRLNKTLLLHQRLLVLLKEGKVHRLKQLLSVAMRNSRNISAIVGKVVDAVAGVYTPHPDQDDKDLAFVIWQIGGPALLDICHKAIDFPCTSTAYNMIKGKKFINSSFDTDAEAALENLKIATDAPKYGGMLKVDETYVDAKVKWCPLDNRVYAFCYDHTRNIDLHLNSYDDITHLAELVEAGTIHICKECMVFVCTSNALKENTQISAR